KQVAVVDGRAGQPWDAVQDLTLAPRGNRVAYAGGRGKTWRIVIDGQEQEGTTQPRSGITFGCDGRRVAWIGTHDDGYSIVVDGESGRTYDAVGTPKFSPDCRRLVYAAMRNGSTVVVTDDEEWPAGGRLGDAIWFSPDSSRVAW